MSAAVLDALARACAALDAAVAAAGPLPAGKAILVARAAANARYELRKVATAAGLDPYVGVLLQERPGAKAKPHDVGPDGRPVPRESGASGPPVATTRAVLP